MNETVGPGVAFRAGVKGMPFVSVAGPQPDIHVRSDKAQGPNELHLTTIEAVPGLSDPQAAYETGRALRGIGYELDQLNLPATQGADRFRPDFANAVVTFKLRNERQPWGAADTAYVFAQWLIDRGTAKPLVDKIEQSIIRYAKQRPVFSERSGDIRS